MKTRKRNSGRFRADFEVFLLISPVAETCCWNRFDVFLVAIVSKYSLLAGK